MSRKVKYSIEEKLNAVQKYLDGKESMYSIANRFGIDVSAVRLWVNKYRAMGVDAFSTNQNKHYTKEEKEQAVAAYLHGEGSLMSICKKFKIHSTAQLRNWIKKYNGHEELKASGTGGTVIMTKGRKTTFDERVEIVKYCIAHNHNYTGTSEQFGVSYQQARNYTIKYEKLGVAGLYDRRGKRKPEEEMTELEKLRAENRILRVEKEQAEMEMNFLKKLAEIERRRG